MALESDDRYDWIWGRYVYITPNEHGYDVWFDGRPDRGIFVRAEDRSLTHGEIVGIVMNALRENPKLQQRLA